MISPTDFSDILNSAEVTQYMQKFIIAWIFSRWCCGTDFGGCSES